MNSRHLLILTLVTLLGAAAIPRDAGAELIFYEPFEGLVGRKLVMNEAWTEGVDMADHIKIGTGSLDVPEGVNLKAPVGHKARVTQTETAQVTLIYREFEKVTEGELYVSLLIRHEKDADHAWAGIGLTEGGRKNAEGRIPLDGEAIYLGKQSAAVRADLAVLETVPNGGQGRIKRKWTADTVRFLVLKLDFDEKKGYIFVNPDCTQPEPGEADTVADFAEGKKPWTAEAIDRLWLDAGSWGKTGSKLGKVAWDELRIGTTWDDVTPAAEIEVTEPAE